MKKQDKQALLHSIGAKIMAYAKNELCMSARFLSSAVGYAQDTDVEDLPTPVTICSMATNGAYVVYDSKILLDLFEQDPKLVTRQYAHLLFHCLYRHFAKAPLVENSLAWDVACDISAEYLVDKLGAENVRDIKGEPKRYSYYDLYLKKVPLLSAEHLYEELKFLAKAELKDLEKIFKRDDHSLWLSRGDGKGANSTKSGERPDQANGDREGVDEKQGDKETPLQVENAGGYSFDEGFGSLSFGTERGKLKEIEEDWKRISERVKLEIESFAQEYGTQTLDLRRIINVELKTTYDYREFLLRFMTLKEIMKEDLTQFDYIYYNLGLMMYGNIPLYDHLEYALDHTLEDFVIAIDSSGSVFYDLAVNFLEECYSIVAQATSTRRRINLHIIQCDSAIKEDVLITGYDDFTRFIKRFTLRGGGGTDFRPVFNRVEELKKSGKMPNLKGMIYFTDGKGKYPEKPPSFDVAFVFYGNDKNDLNVPPWAMKLVIEGNGK